MIMMPAAMSSDHRQSLMEYASESVTSTAAVVSETTRMKLIALT
jgi:hypothetical protein